MTNGFTQFLARDFYRNAMQTWLISLGVAVLLFTVLRLMEQVIITRIQKLTKRTSTRWDDIVVEALRKTKLWFLAIVAIGAGATLLELPDIADRILERTIVIAFLVQAGIWARSALMKWLRTYREDQIKEDAASVMTMNALGFVVPLALWSRSLYRTSWGIWSPRFRSFSTSRS
jgi:hypothetical protein